MSLDSQRSSLLIPPNPAFVAADSRPQGGILINGGHSHRLSEPSFSFHTLHGGSTASGSTASLNPPAKIIPPPSPDPALRPSSEQSHNSRPSTPGLAGGKPKIRFAPLPDPRRPRSLSTGRNIAYRSTLGPNGVETRTLELRGMDDGEGNDDQVIVDDDYDNEEDADEDEGEEERSGKRGRSWSKTMGSSWKGTKKLLSGKNPIKDKDKDNDALTPGVPLARSSSTGGLIGASPFRWTVETERKNNMQGPPPASVTSLLSARRSDNNDSSSSSGNIPIPASPKLIPGISGGHRRNSSLEQHRGSTSLGTSPGRPVRMLNGRVYGSRRASEAAEREREYREKLEPAFIEWGSSNGVGNNAVSGARSGAGLGSSGARAGAGIGGGRRQGFDEDDGGGMAWVKRRREERERKAQEEKERQQMQLGETDKVGGRKNEGEGHGSGSPGAEGGEVGGGLTSSQSSQSSRTSFDMPETTGGESKPKLRLGVEETDLQTPATDPSELPSQSPAIHISPVVSVPPRIDVHLPPSSPSFSSSHDHDHDNIGLSPVEISRQAEEQGKTMTISTSPMTDRKTEKQAMVIPSDKSRKAASSPSPMNPHQFGFTDPFAEVNPMRVGQTRNLAEGGTDEDENEEEDEEGEEEDDEEEGGEDDDDDDEDDDDDGDFDDDVVRTTSSAAGVEVISRHRN
ncbi:hypothetical protein AYX15_00151 [Cryptococcus neoformans]|nr:hypothetical protein AYX15_00151 [Cryptococcus neoformans var. grubii]